MSRETYRKIQIRKDISLSVNVKECLEDILALLENCSYGDLYVSTRQKIAVWNYRKEYQFECKGRVVPALCDKDPMPEKDFLDELFLFFYNSSIDAGFIRYCAKREGENPVRYVLGLLS